MWKPDDYSYDEFSVFGLKVSLDLQNGLRRNNPALELEGALYAVICVLDRDLVALPPHMLPLDGEGGQELKRVFVDCFGPEKPFACVRAGRTLVLAIRSEGPAADEDDFMEELLTCTNHLAFALEDELGESVSLSLSSVFNEFRYCEQVACEALTAADFVRFVEMPIDVVTPQYCDNVKQLLEKKYPDYRISNYERPMISAILNGNLAHAERVLNDLMTAHLLDPMPIFPTLRSSILNTLRMCQSMVSMDPRTLTYMEPRLPLLQQEIRVCPNVSTMRSLIHAYFELLDHHFRQNQEKEATTERMGKIIRYICDNVSNPLLGAPMVCEEFNMSTTYFSRLFKENMGVNFSVYLQTLRITQAKTLLLETDMTLNVIAEKVGYIGSQNLLRLFKRYEGMSPSSYRQMASGNYVPGEEE